MKRIRFTYFIFFSVVFFGCAVQKPFYNKKESDWKEKKIPELPVKYTVFLLGDPGEDNSNEAYNLVKHSIREDDTSHAIVVFGNALKQDESKKKKNDENRISSFVSDLSKDKGKIIFIPDPDQKIKDASEIKNQLEKNFEGKNIFIPDPGCLSVDVLDMTNDLIAIPIHIILRDQDDILKKHGCDLDSHEEQIDEVKDLVDNNQRKNILMLAYYPMLNLGNHGGHFAWRQHLFPLTDLNKNLYIPLPVFGSIYYLLRSGFGIKNDQAYPPYKSYRRKIARALTGYGNVVYASGQEHNFQYFKFNKQDFIITNSSGKTSWVGQNKRAGFTFASSGVVKLTYLKNGEVWLETIIPDKENKEGRVVHRKRLKDNVYGDPDDSTSITSSEQIKDSTIYLAADERLSAGKFKTFFMGQHYRQAWITPVKIPVLDLRTEKGGLQIVKKGGGFQTKSLQLKNKKGEEYSLRSVSKYPERLLGPAMVNTLAADVVKDQVSSSHPYSPYVVDDLSEAAGVLHSHPKMVFIPNDKLLAEYKKDFANTIALFEQRAEGNMRPAENFGYARESVNSKKMLEEIHDDNANAVDDYTFLKSRLFDMWINDWDRHEGQWRWGEIDCDSSHDDRCAKLKARKKYFVPIPKDRDQAFSRFDGVIPWLAGRKWAVRKFQDFTDDIRDVPGLNFNARNIDHALLSELSREEWNQIATALQAELTDEKIEHAIKQLPDTIYKIDGAFITERLKSRRDKLSSIAMRYYKYLAKGVDVVGSDKQEYFKVTRINNDSTSVEVFDYSDGVIGPLIYSRTFFSDETKEIRLYGMKGDDKIEVAGKVTHGILLRIIGGKGNDTVIDDSHVASWAKKTKVYDDKEQNVLKLGDEGKDLTSDADDVNDYDFYANSYNVVAPATFFGYNKDDGVFLGGGLMIKRHGFRKSPYANLQRIVANVAVVNLSFHLRYVGDFNNVIGKWGVNINADLLAPNGTTNFFGMGNDTKRLSVDDEYYRFRYDEFKLFASLKKHIGKYHSIKIGPMYEYVKIRNERERFITSSEGIIYLQKYSARNFTGGRAEYEFRRTDDSVLTFRGFKWQTSIESLYDLDNSVGEATNLESKMCLYIPVGYISSLAIRAGGAYALGDFEVFHANTLGGLTLEREAGNLRGYLRSRYSGRSCAYLNTDLRIKLFRFRTYLFPAHFGILGFYDVGRVWADSEKSTTWHDGYGGGIWVDPFGRAVINCTYAVSREENLITVGIGFLF
jgi:hypothetical protein